MPKLKDNSRLNQLKRDIKKWKKEGYEIEDIERLVDFARKQQKPSEIKIIIKITIVSILIALFLIFFTVVVGSFVITQLAFGNIAGYDRIDGELGFPLRWFYVSYASKILHNGTMEISNWLYLIINFIFYVFFIFCLIYFPRILLKKLKERRRQII